MKIIRLSIKDLALERKEGKVLCDQDLVEFVHSTCL
mgnify:CR=1 FL=1